MSDLTLGFNGLRPDPLNGDYHPGYGYRTYSRLLMRFAVTDAWSPFGAGGTNPYAYCTGDPVNRSDPSGHMSWQAGLGIALGLAGIAGAIFTAGASLAAAGSLSAALATTSVAGMAVGASALVADVTGLASVSIEQSHPQAATTLGWVSLATGLLSLGVSLVTGGYRALERVTGSLRSRLVKVNGHTGIPMSGEFRNARFLGANHNSGELSWNLRFEDTVPRGRRLTIIMGSRYEGTPIRPCNEVSIDGAWVSQTYAPADFRDLVLEAHEEFDVYRLVIPNSAVRYNSGQRTIAGDFRFAMHTESPVVGYRGPPVVQGQVATELQHVFGLYSQFEQSGIAWGAHSAQQMLNGLSDRFGAVEGAITFEGQHVVYPHYFRMAALEPNWQ